MIKKTGDSSIFLIMTDDTFLFKTAPQFDVHKWSDYPEVTRVVDAIFGEIKTLRTSRNERIRGADKVKRHLRVVLIDLWAASKLSLNPYRSISKNKTDYQRESRYRKIHLKYDYLIGIINDLVQLGYIKEKLSLLPHLLVNCLLFHSQVMQIRTQKIATRKNLGSPHHALNNRKGMMNQKGKLLSEI